MSRRTRIDFVSPPFRGHLHPLLGLARALSAIADVRVLTTPALAGEVEASGVCCRPVMRGRDAAIAAIVNPAYAVRSHPLRLWRQFRETLRFLAEMRVELQAEWRSDPPDLAIVDSVLPAAGCAAESCAVPWWTSLASPCVLETRRGAPAYLGGLKHRDDAWGRVRDAAGGGLVRTFKRAVFALHRRRLRALGVDRLYRKNGDEAAYSPECILGLGLRELEFPREWPAAVRLIGPVLFTPPVAAPVEIELEPGRAHVLATFGTHLGWIKDRLADQLRCAAEERQSFVVHFSDGAPNSAVRENSSVEAPSVRWFRRHAYVPYDGWLGRFDLVLHHGGAGVMYHCISAARPSLVYPIDYDQFDHAARIERAGIGRRVRNFTRIGDEIERALRDPPPEACARMQAQLGDTSAEKTVRELVEQRQRTWDA